MRVLIITSSFPRWEEDFAGIFILQMVKALKARGLDVEVISPGAFGVPKDEVLKDIPVHRFTYTFPPRLQKLAYQGGIPSNVKKSWIARLEVIPFLFSIFLKTLQYAKRIDLLHIHWIPISIPVLIVSRLIRKPTVMTVHGSDVYPQGFLKPLSSFLLRKTDRVICVSRSLREKVVELGVPLERVWIVPNGVEVGVERLREFEESSEPRLQDLQLLWIGRMSEEKGLIDLLKGMKMIIRDFPKVSLILVGDGPLRRELEEKSRFLKIQDYIHFVGERPHGEIREFLRGSSLFVLPSLSEGLPTVLLEAMAFEKAVVATRVGGIPEIVQERKTGLLVPPSSPELLAKAVIHLLGNDRMRTQFGREGKQYVEVHFTWEKSAREIVKIYNSIVKEEVRKVGD
jgi:glycosyltransferase involved in cell wall biosynthesis